jgi:hypothetical protein
MSDEQEEAISYQLSAVSSQHLQSGEAVGFPLILRTPFLWTKNRRSSFHIFD